MKILKRRELYQRGRLILLFEPRDLWIGVYVDPRGAGALRLPAALSPDPLATRRLVSPRALDVHANPNLRTKGTKMTDQAQSPHEGEEPTVTDGPQSRPASPGEAFAAYEPTGNLRDPRDDDYEDDEPVRVEIEEDREPTPEEDARMRAIYRQPDDNGMPGDPPFDLEDLKRRLDEALSPGHVITGSDLPRPAVTYNWRTRPAGLDEMLSRHHALYVVDQKTLPGEAAIEMTEETPFIFGRPGFGESVQHDPALLAAESLDAPMRLAMHLAGVHADATAIDEDHGASSLFHRQEHARGGWDHAEDDLSYDPARAIEILARYREDAEDGSLSQGFHLALHLASAHKDDQAFFRTDEQNEAAHSAIPAFLHRHAGVQHRYERALAEKIEADLADGTTMSWCPVPHPPHEVSDLARMVGDIHDQNPGMAADLIAVDLAWIKTAAWPWHRRLLAAVLLAFPLSWPPSSYIDKRVRKAVRK